MQATELDNQNPQSNIKRTVDPNAYAMPCHWTEPKTHSDSAPKQFVVEQARYAHGACKRTRQED